MKTLILTLALTATPFLACAAPLTLVQNGQPNATIVLQADAPKPVQAAATDLQHYIQKISGVELPLKTDGKDVPGITLNVGKTESTRESDLPDAKLNPETYAITQRGDDIYFAGHHPSPTAFAVYSFLQDQLGVRWFAPGEDWEYVPSKSAANFIVDVKSTVTVPDWSPRIWSGHHWTPTWQAWNLRNKTVQSERVPRRQFQNNMYRVFPASQYGKTHPEYYPLINGKRRIPTEDTDRYWWPCIGNPDVQRITVEHMRDFFNKNPQADSFSLGMDDIVYMCSCSLCRKLDANPDDYEKRKFSDRFYKFVNIVAKDLKQTHPDKFIGTLIYNIARELPQQVDRLEDNVFGYITQNSGNWYNPEIKKADIELTRQWAKRVKRLSRYDYFGFASFVPRVYPQSIDEEMKFDKALGFEGMYVEMYTFLPHTAPMLWAYAQLQWDTQQSMDALLNEYYSKVFPSTAPAMKAYYELLEKSWNTMRSGHTGAGWEHRDILKQAVSISAEDTRRGLQMLDTAYAQATTDVEKRRIDVVRGGLRYASYAVFEYDLAQRIAALEVSTASDAQAGREMVQEFSRLVTERKTYWPQASARQDLLGENLRGLGNMTLSNREAYLQTNTSRLNSPAIPGIIHLLDWYRKNQPEQADTISNDLLQTFPSDSVGRTISAWNWVAKNKPASLIQNGNFESTAPNTVAAGQPDWNTEGAPSGWNTWSSLGGGKFALAPGRETGQGVRIGVPLGDNAVVLQNVPVQAGKTYLATTWVKPSDKGNAAGASLSFRMRTKTGWATGSGASISTNASGQQWQPLVISVTIPKNVVSVTLMLGVKDTEAIFDDAALYEVP
jgi:hypothetical protein